MTDILVYIISIEMHSVINYMLFRLCLVRMRYALLCFVYVSLISTVMKPLSMHLKCRGGVYPRSHVMRFSVPDEKVAWKTAYPEYKPPEYTAESAKAKPWADPADTANASFHPKWNSVDGQVDRSSFHGPYEIVNGRPMNPMGRTGISGRGVLGKFGPNHAADPIVTRWKCGFDGSVVQHAVSKKALLECVLIERHDCHEWALPGGMVDPGEQVSATLQREFGEEALSSLQMSDGERAELQSRLQRMFSEGQQIYSGYVDDPRNTDNSWMETTAMLFHDDSGETLGKLALRAGDDARAVRWATLHCGLRMYASHLHIIEQVVHQLQAHWQPAVDQPTAGQ